MSTLQSSLLPLNLVAVLGCGLMAGVFFAFSTFVMPALSRIESTAAIAAMQSINIAVINPLFMIVFLGTAIVCFYLIFTTLFSGHPLAHTYLLVGSLLYLVGTVLVTIIGNVPLNDALAIAQSNSTDGAALWARYLRDWTFWNHVRTIASLAATASFAIALRTGASQS